MSTSFGQLYTSRLSGEGEFRLLTVQPEIGEDQWIHCILHTVNIKEHPSYICLSYTWGPPTSEAADEGITSRATHYIRCNGNTILVTKNLYDFLQRVRRDRELCSQNFWVDSICINQEDQIERASQVSSMASVYRSADMVIAWLGEKDIYTEDAFSLIRTVGSLSEDNLKQVVARNVGAEDIVDFRRPLSSDWAWNSMKQLWRRNYFKRAWIIQEVALAKRILVICGEYFLDWDHIARVSRILTLTPWKRASNMNAHDRKARVDSTHTLPLYLNSNRKMVSSGKGCDLLSILIKARRFQCSDPRDKVYALLGLLGDHAKDKMRLRPVYKGRSTADVYVSTAIQILEDTNDLLLLAHAEGQDFQHIEDLPSWVPDWSCEKGLGLGITGYTRFAAAASLPRFLRIDESNKSLVVRGLKLDRIVQVGESKEDAINHKGLAYFPGWISILSALPPKYHTGQPSTEVFWRTLITDTAGPNSQPAQHPAADNFKFAFSSWLGELVSRWRDEPPSTEKKHFLEKIDHLGASDQSGLFLYVIEKQSTSLLNDSDRSALLKQTNSSDPPLTGDYEVRLNYSTQTRLVRTNNNYLGLATTSVRENDSVWIVAGSRIPLILRETSQRHVYRLVGGAYIHGFMQGEALQADTKFTDIEIV
ncbi:heterokaryon incompatibility protein-domain-containing protein [Aspergillus pseudocaelatus]|uniref:Heterokaryon incompatibility protein-domain-containing protein n=1 Tax=Aspergillus pseudocaelatus TaxID=1825620 RepID=A0ABQ6W7N9_9EURO|nr:heterokaryon incompatibility protein-domain-containing protein [Aspergillus pseudocaelatus]